MHCTNINLLSFKDSVTTCAAVTPKTPLPASMKNTEPFFTICLSVLLLRKIQKMGPLLRLHIPVLPYLNPLE
jgi:hypothetical protein